MRTFSFSDFLFLLTALRWTVLVTLISLVLGAPLALAMAVMRTGGSRVARWLAGGLTQIIQGVPLLGLLVLFYFGLPMLLKFNMPTIIAVSIAYAVYTGAFLGDIWRGSILAVKATQWEAAACLGITRWQQFRYVVAPQAVRAAIPPTVGFLVQLIKGTSLASVVGMVELARAGQIASAATFQPLLIYSIVAAIYFAICLPLTTWSRSLEVRFAGAR
jgi:polar amino acid transport system permease protein